MAGSHSIRRGIQRFMWSILMMLIFTSCESRKPIVNDLEEKEANEIVVFLDQKGIDAEKQKQLGGGPGGGSAVLYQITVTEDQATNAMAILNMHGLPRRRSQNLLGIFGQGGLVPSEMEEKIKYQAGLAEQIASTIRKIDGVLDADIQLSVPEENLLNPDAQKKDRTASVYVKHQGVLDDPNSHLRTKIQRLVSSSIEGLKFENVTVIADRARFIGDPNLAIFEDFGDSNTSFVTVWTVMVATDSVGRFQTIFLSFFVALLGMGLLMIWVIWKVYPILSSAGGFSRLFTLQPIMAPDLSEEEPEEDLEKSSEEEGESEEGEEDEESEEDEDLEERERP